MEFVIIEVQRKAAMTRRLFIIGKNIVLKGKDDLSDDDKINTTI